MKNDSDGRRWGFGLVAALAPCRMDSRLSLKHERIAELDPANLVVPSGSSDQNRAADQWPPACPAAAMNVNALGVPPDTLTSRRDVGRCRDRLQPVVIVPEIDPGLLAISAVMHDYKELHSVTSKERLHYALAQPFDPDRGTLIQPCTPHK